MVSLITGFAVAMHRGVLPRELQQRWQHGRQVASEIFILDLSTNRVGGEHMVIKAHENGTESKERVLFSGSPQFVGNLIETPGNGVATNSPVIVCAKRVNRNVFGELRGRLSIRKAASERRDYEFLLSGQFLFLDRKGIQVVLRDRSVP